MQKQSRNQRMLNLRNKLKMAPILHSTSDRIKQKLQKGQFVTEQIMNNSSTQFQTKSISLGNSSIKLKSFSQKPVAFEKKYKIGQILGQGAHGLVKKCYHKQTHAQYAVKFIRHDDEFLFYLKRNFTNIEQLDHPNVIKYKAFYIDIAKQTCLLVMEFLPYPDLYSVTIDTPEELKRIIYEVIKGIEYIHSKNICHRDIKPQNILYDKQNTKQVKLIDFGVSCKVLERGTKKQMLTLTGTPFYRAPQMFTGGGYDHMVDMWALGVMIFKLITNITPFQSQYHSDTINNILKGEVSFNSPKWDKYDYLVKDLVMHLLKPRQKRLTAKQAKGHFWFEEIRRQQQERLQLTKSAEPDVFFSLKRTTTYDNGRNSLRPRKPTINNPNTPENWGSPQFFKLQNYQKQTKMLRWLNLDDGRQMDLIESQEEQNPNSPSPTLKYKNKQMKNNKK